LGEQFGFTRVHQRDWDSPVCSEWIETIDREISTVNAAEVILVGHSLACSTVAFWAKQFNRKIKGALLVAPSDTEGESYPPGTSGFKPMPSNRIPFPTIAITSSNDVYVTLERANQFARAWGSELINIGEAGHINVASGFGPWPEGLTYLKQLDA
jgi:uncharacterized protein